MKESFSPDRVFSSLVVSLGLIVTSFVIRDALKSSGNQPSTHFGRYQFYIENNDSINLETTHCRDTLTGIEYIRQVGTNLNWNRFFSVNYLTGEVTPIWDSSKQ